MRSMNSQFSELSQHPNLRRDGAVDGVDLQVTATHPPMSAQVFWKMGGGWVWAPYKYSSFTKFPISVGMEPLMAFSYRILLPPTHSAPRLLGAGWRVQMRSMNSQFSELSQHPNLRRDGAVDVVLAHVTATHPAMSAQVCWKMGGGWVWSTYR
jgi:hypothetical protein